MTHIQITPTHTAYVGPGAVELFRLAALIAALRCEHNTGMQLTRGRSALAIAKLTTGLRTNDRTTHIARLEKMLDEQRAQVPVTDTRPVAALMAGIQQQVDAHPDDCEGCDLCGVRRDL